jgi:hypothetical protein
MKVNRRLIERALNLARDLKDNSPTIFIHLEVEEYKKIKGMGFIELTESISSTNQYTLDSNTGLTIFKRKEVSIY